MSGLATRRCEAVRNGLVVMLAAATGSLDAVAFLGLGGVFVSVITGNVVLVSIGIAKLEAALVLRAGAATLAYGVGIALGRLVVGRASDDQLLWPRRVTGGLVVELVLLAGFCGGWELAGAKRTSVQDVSLLALAAAAMGVQSATVVRLDVPGFSSTYLTSTYIRVVSGLVTGAREHAMVKLLALCAALAGAVVGTVILTAAPRWVPAFALAVIAIVGAIGATLSRRGGPLDVPRPRIRGHTEGAGDG